MRILRKLTQIFVVASLSLMSASASAVEVLFVHVSNSYIPYHTDGNEIAGYVHALPGYNVTIRDLNSVVYNDYANYAQIWVYDLYQGSDNNVIQAANYANIAAWYNGLGATQHNLIADGRIISSATGSPWHAEPTWIQGYATELQDNGRTGGLVLGTDHDAYIAGINQINAAIGISLFTGDASPTVHAFVDPLSPLYHGGAGTFACGTGDQCVWDNSSPSYVPTGLQTNGQTLTPVAYHGTTNTAFANAAISSTLGSATFGTCGGPNQPPCETPEPATLTIFSLGLGLIGLGLIRRRKRMTG